MPELLRDFECRCAYSMQHLSHAGGALEVDHFDPRQKKNLIQCYSNLFPASRFCNGKKSNTWPTRGQQRLGIRFLNPCEEIDYGEQLFEDPATHRIVGSTVAAKWHIVVCGLNAPHFVAERRRRSEIRQLLSQTACSVHGETSTVEALTKALWRELEGMIPMIESVPEGVC